ncbi:MAG TPA: InlB B-repeat-containing protein [Clostridia bacterium]|nr:InlB B-repeat-containing protein [Clostridia bacterium]
MKGIFKKTFILFLVCALFLTGGALNVALAEDTAGEVQQVDELPDKEPQPVGDPAGDELQRVDENLMGLPHFVSYLYYYSDEISLKEMGELGFPPNPGLYFSGASVTIADDPSREGYIFEGWSTSDLDLPENATGFTMPNHHVVFHGKWYKAYTANYRFEGDAPYTAPSAKTYKNGETMIPEPVIVQPGYSFDGWYLEGDRENIVTSYTFNKSNVTFVGYWTAIDYSVKYEFAGEYPAKAVKPTDSTIYHVGDTVYIQTPTEYSSFSNFTFDGWWLGETKIEGGSFEMPSDNVTLTGKWTKTATPGPLPVIYAVDYLYTGNVPVNAPALPGTNYYYVGTTAHVASAPQLAGYTFSGWMTTDVAVVNGAFAIPYKNVTFTGYWVPGVTTTVIVPNTGGEPMALVPAMLLLSGLALMAVTLRRRAKKQ